MGPNERFITFMIRRFGYQVSARDRLTTEWTTIEGSTSADHSALVWSNLGSGGEVR